MKKLLLLLLMAGLWSCGQSSNQELTQEQATEETTVAPETPETTPEPEVVAEPENVPIEKESSILGYYVGDFEASKYRENRRPSYINRINISIDRLTGDSIYGHSVVAGNDRPFNGTYEMNGDIYQVQVKEPGDDRYDGAFTFEIHPDEQLLKGIWVANNTNLAVYERKFYLPKKTFKYNPNLDLPEDVSWAGLYNSKASEEFVEEGEFITEDVLKINASKRLLNKDEVENMYRGDLEIVRNAIYARHGYSFKNRKNRYIFDSYVDWYIPVSTDIRAQLTSIEKQNIELIKRYEQHAERYYDVFGR